MKTIKQTGWNGNEREYTSEQFVQAWISQVSDLYKIAYTEKENEQVRTIRAQIADMAASEFERIYESQTQAA